MADKTTKIQTRYIVLKANRVVHLKDLIVSLGMLDEGKKWTWLDIAEELFYADGTLSEEHPENEDPE